MESTSMTSKYMNFSPELVYERNAALNNCPTKSGRSKIYKTYYLKMKDAYEKDDEEYEASEAEASEAEASEAEASDPEDEDYEPSEAEEDEEAEEEEQSDAEAEEYEIKIEVADESDAEEEDVIYITEADAEVDSEDENEFGCAGCNYEWRDGYKNGWRDAMKYITNKTHKVVPPTPACSYCDIVCKTHKCGGKCGGTARYCSIECQKQDWAFGHKANCGK